MDSFLAKFRSALNDLESAVAALRLLASDQPADIPWPPNTVEERDALLASGKCISCKMSKASKLIRGTCSSCQTIRSREAIDPDRLVEMNLLMPKRKPGRKQEIGSPEDLPEDTKEDRAAKQLALDADAFMRGAIPELEAIRTDLSARYDDAQKTAFGDTSAPSEGAQQAEIELTPEQYRELSRQAKLIAEEADRMAEQVEPEVRRAHAQEDKLAASKGPDDAGPQKKVKRS